MQVAELLTRLEFPSREPIVVPDAPDGHAAGLEPVLETETASGPVRIGAPGRGAWRQVNGNWLPASRAHVDTAMQDRVLCARFLLIERARPSKVITTVAELPVAAELADLLAWLGWPHPNQDGSVPATIEDRLRARSNDYWLLNVILSRLVRAALPAFPGVSVVVPARDVHSTLSDTVAAVVASAGLLPAGTAWECLIVDDQSDPPLHSVVRTHPQVKIIRASQRVYCGGARNLGIRHARYPLLVFVDGDTAIAANYLLQHAIRHLVMPHLMTVSLREQLPVGVPVPDRLPDGNRDTRVEAHYQPGRRGLIPVTEPVTVRCLDETKRFRDFGHARHLGPVDLPFMVKGTSFTVPAQLARIGFPPDFVGYGPEDGSFAAKAIARGAFVVPVLSTGVFHREHPPRSGSYAARDAELDANLVRQARHLRSLADAPWVTDTPTGEGAS